MKAQGFLLDLSIWSSVPKITALLLKIANVYSAYLPWPRPGKEPAAEAESLISALPFPSFTFPTSTSLQISSLYPGGHQPVANSFSLTPAIFFPNITLGQLMSVQTHECLCQEYSAQAVASPSGTARTQRVFTLCPRAQQRVPPSHPSAAARGKPGLSLRAKPADSAQAWSWGRCLSRLAVRPGLAADGAA